MTRYAPSRSYLRAGIIALALSAFCGWFALDWPSASIPAVLFLLSAGLLLFLGSRAAIGIGADCLLIGKRRIPWTDVVRVDRTGWISPLLVYLTLADSRRLLLIYPGDLDTANNLLRNLRRSAANALIDGIPYRQFWGELPPAGQDRAKLPSPRYKVLRDEDEAEVERLYQLLKTVGHLDSTNSSEEK